MQKLLKFTILLNRIYILPAFMLALFSPMYRPDMGNINFLGMYLLTMPLQPYISIKLVKKYEKTNPKKALILGLITTLTIGIFVIPVIVTITGGIFSEITKNGLIPTIKRILFY
ncbi:MAG: hypothetical protein ACOZAK_03300 [Patescibacteria group bacterium]